VSGEGFGFGGVWRGGDGVMGVGRDERGEESGGDVGGGG
jgi:hypothetical protein